MLLTLITVTYNSALTLRETIESVIAQTYPNIEYIVIDGASTDGTMQIAKEYKDWIDILISEKDGGIYDAMNKGARLATGEVIGFVNSDDILISPTAIEEMMCCFKGTESPGAVYGDLYFVARGNLDKIVRHWRSGPQRPFARGWHPPHLAFFVKRELFEREGGFDTDFSLAADFDLMLRLIEGERIALHYLPKPLVKMRLGGASNKNLRNIVIGNLECIRSFHKNGMHVSVFYPLLRLVPKLKQFIC